MRKLLLVLGLLMLPLMTGCALSDVFYNLFGDAYSGGGSTDAARRADFNDRVNASRSEPAIGGASANPFTP